MNRKLVALFAATFLGCANRGPDKDSTVLGPGNATAVYKLAAIPLDNALLRLSGLTGQALAGRVKVDAYLREFHLVNGVETLVETRVSTATAQADATFAFFISDLPGDGDANGIVDFEDFFLLADTFGLRDGVEKFNPVFDMDGSGIVDLTDFFIFADNFGRRSSRAAGKPTGIASSVSYEDAPRGEMIEEVFLAAWGELHERLRPQGGSEPPQAAAKQLQASEPEYRFHIQSLETPSAFVTFDVIITGSFPAPGDPPRELLATPAGVVGSITQTLFISPQDTTVAYGESPAARGILTTLYDGVPSLVQAVTPVPTSRDTVENADGSLRVTARFSHEDLSAAQTITVLAPPPPLDTEPPLLSVQFLDGNAQLRVTADDNSVAELSVSITVAGRTIAEQVAQEAGAPTDYNTGLAYDPSAPWRTSAVSVQVSDGLNEAVLDTMLALEDFAPPMVTIADGGSISADGRVSLSFDAEDGQSGVPRSGSPISIVARFPDNSEARGTYSSLNRSASGVSGTVSSVFGSPNTGSPRNVEVLVQVVDEAGNMGQSSVTLRQNTYSAPPPPPPPPPEPEPEPEPVPTPVAPSISAATANGIASGGMIITTAGSAITLSASFSGEPSPSATWSLASRTASGSSTSITAASGNLVLTVTNSAGTQTRTWQVAALGAP